ncbi:uncharacterized protein PHACADRAFT_99025 [Phanerochaete carnosa HHB-10118-sp]|uniref:F-box domain-containing protein n=1 Tax=Phanerochaete carnosa (strain HHB-10118-sp) TaxID=650164 RepID=K5WRS0_PHACS|nr:uncharacterized protein PHACADRAFT_99025 [Phanerochaete carnosa HHB-10118-sp]EKM53087.1 hypothetical protein PHACADRAFT_99025 [Phanerochaete carnosa HHB-10118-sp]
MVDYTAFPVELWEKNLENVPAQNMVRFQSVSRFARNLVQNSAALQYRIEQYCMSTVDGPAFRNIALNEKVEIQKEWHRAWRVFGHASTVQTIECSGSPTTCLSVSLRPAYIKPSRRSYDNSLRFVRPPSKLRGVGLKVWTLENLPEFSSRRFAYDYDQDLLVIVPKSVDDRKVELLILSCTTGETHPLAKSRALLNTYTDAFQRGSERLLVHADMIAMLSYSHEGYNLWVWDWKRAELLMSMTVTTSNLRVKDFAFMDARHVLVLVQVASGDSRIMVFDCYAPQVSACSTDKSVLAVAAFDLPKQHVHRTAFHTARMRTRLCSKQTPFTSDTRFRWTPHSNIALISLDPYFKLCIYLIIPLHLLTTRFHDPSIESNTMRPVPWEEWGMHTLTLQTGCEPSSWSIVGGSRLCAHVPFLGHIYLREVREKAGLFDLTGADWAAMRAPFRATLVNYRCCLA